MRALQIARMTGIAKPTEDVAKRLRALHGPSFVRANLLTLFDDLDAIDLGLAPMLHRGFEAGCSSDGRLDLRVVASHVLEEIRGAQRPSEALARVLRNPDMRARARRIEQDELMVRGFADVLDRAFAASLIPTGHIDFRMAAAHVLRVMRENQA